MNIPRNQWTGPSHPDTLAAFDHVDAAMFTGDPAESRERFNLYKKYVDRWLKQLDEVEPRLIEKEYDIMLKTESPSVNITIEECLSKIDTMPDFPEKNQLRSLVKNYGYLGAIKYLKPLNWVNSGRNQALADSHSKILQEMNSAMEKLCVDAYRAGNYRPLQDVIDELRNSIVEPTFDEVIAEFRSGKLSVDRWNFVIQPSQFGKWEAYIMGEGSEQCLTYKSGFATKDEIYNLFVNLGVKRILSSVG